MRRLIQACATAALGLALVPGAALADHGCNGEVTTIETPDGTDVMHIDDRGIDFGGVWVYLETNGFEGLQSGGESVILGADDVDPCVHETPDTLVV